MKQYGKKKTPGGGAGIGFSHGHDDCELCKPPTETRQGRRLAREQAKPECQAWFWTEEWQAGEREADEDLRLGRWTEYRSDHEFLESL